MKREMKKTVLLFWVLVMFMSVSCSLNAGQYKGADAAVTSKGADVEKDFKLSGFDKIVLKGSVDIKYVQGDNFSVIAKGARSMVDNLDIVSDGTTLTVGFKEKKAGVSRQINGSATVYVASPALTAVSIVGSGDFSAERHVTAENMELSVKGSGDIDFEDLKCKILKAEVIGSGDIEMDKVMADKAGLVVKGSGDISARFKNGGSVYSSIQGSGDIRLKGDVRSERHDVRGSGDVSTSGLVMR